MFRKLYLILAWVGCVSNTMAGASSVGATAIDVADDNIIYRPSNSLWAVSENPGPYPAGVAPVTGAAVFFGLGGDVPLVGDVNGDNVDDIVVRRSPVGGSNQYFAGHTNKAVTPHQIGLSAPAADSSTGNFGTTAGTLASFLADMNGDGIDDVLRATSTTFDWKYRPSTAAGLTNGNASDSAFLQFGLLGGTDQPIVGDFDGNGRDDVGVYRAPAGNIFWSGTGGPGVNNGVLGNLGLGPIGQIGIGGPGDILLIGNLNGDVFDDAVMVRQDGAGLIEWFGLINDGTGLLTFGNPGTTLSSFGLDNGGDIPFLADIDGDGLDDIGITRGVSHFTTLTTAGGVLGTNGAGDASWDFGLVGDVQLFGDFVGVPEPSSIVLLAFGALSLVGSRRRRG